MKDAILVVVGIAVGLGIGFAVWGGEEEKKTATQAETDAGRDVWLTSPCPPGGPEGGSTVQDKLQSIVNKVGGMPAPTPEAVDCMVRAFEVMWAQPPAPYDVPSGHVAAAADHADGERWIECKGELDQVQ